MQQEPVVRASRVMARPSAMEADRDTDSEESEAACSDDDGGSEESSSSNSSDEDGEAEMPARRGAASAADVAEALEI